MEAPQSKLHSLITSALAILAKLLVLESCRIARKAETLHRAIDDADSDYAEYRARMEAAHTEQQAQRRDTAVLLFAQALSARDAAKRING